jgi:hypothetical protein
MSCAPSAHPFARLIAVQLVRGTARASCCVPVAYPVFRQGALRTTHVIERCASCRRMAETQFWAIYFKLVGNLVHEPPEDGPTVGEPAPDSFHRASSRGKSQQTTPSAMSAWEEVARDSPGAGPGQRQAAASPPQTGDDLDEYLKVGCAAYCHEQLMDVSTSNLQAVAIRDRGMQRRLCALDHTVHAQCRASAL